MIPVPPRIPFRDLLKAKDEGCIKDTEPPAGVKEIVGKGDRREATH